MQTLSSGALTKNTDELAQMLTKAGKPPEEPDAPHFGQLIPFDHAESTLPRFPWEALPDALADMADSMATFCETDIALAAVPALANAAGAIGRTFLVSPKEGWEEPLNLYALTVAESAETKSAVMRPLNNPFYAFQSEWNKDHKSICDSWDDACDALRGRIDQLKKDAKKAQTDADRSAKLRELEDARRKLADKEEHPERALRLTTGDSTPESLQRDLAENNETLCIVSSEGGLIDSLTGARYQEEGKVNIDLLLNAYSGDFTQSSRITRESITLNHPCLTVNVCCQPVTVQELVSNKVFNRRGLVGRFLYAFPPSKAGYRTGDKPAPLPEVKATYNRLINDLLKIRVAYMGEEPRIIRFSEGAFRAYLCLFQEKELLLRNTENDNPLRAWAGRMHGHCVRLAGLLHVLEHMDQADEEEVTEDTFQRAATLTRYFRANAEHAFSLADDSTSAGGQYIWSRIIAQGVQEQINRGPLMNICKRFKESKAMQPALDELAERGYIYLEERHTGGRPAEIIHINPAAIEYEAQKHSR